MIKKLIIIIMRHIQPKVIRKGEYLLDRNRLLSWVKLTGQLDNLIKRDAANDMLLSGEYIVTVEDLIEYMETIPGQLFEDVESYREVHYSCVKVVYNLEQKDVS